MRWILLLFVVSIASVGNAQDFVATPEQKQKVLNLLDQSLENEVKAIASADKESNWNTINSFMTQIKLRGRAGKAGQIDRITSEIAAKHVDRNLDRSKARFSALSNRYKNLNSTPDGLNDLIQKGQLDEVFEIIQSKAWADEKPQSEADLPKGEAVKDAKQLSMLQLDKFWIACRLACAYHAQDNPAKVRKSLNFARSVLEGNEPTGKEFDADLDWLPPAERSIGLTAVRQHRITFCWTLVQSGFAELGIDLFKKDVVAIIAKNSKKKSGTDYWSGDLSGQVYLQSLVSNDRLAKFVPVVVNHVSPQAATDLIQELFPEEIPLKVNLEIIKACLEIRSNDIATWHLDQVVKSTTLPNFETSYYHGALLEILVKHQKIAQANRLTDKLIDRIEIIDAQTKRRAKATNDPPTHINYRNWARLAETVVPFNQDSAMRLVELHQNVIGKGEWDDWVEIETVRAKCQKISRAKELELTGNCFSVDLVDAYLESGQIEKAKQVLNDAALTTMKSTYSGSSIGDGPNQLAVLDFNARDRIVLAMRAVQLDDLELVRKLFADMPSNYNQREGHRAVAQEILKHWGFERTIDFIKNTQHEIGASGAIIGLGQMVFPEHEDDFVVPKPFLPSC